MSETGDIDVALRELLTDLGDTLGPTLGAAVPLGGGITNRNFRVRFAPPVGEGVLRLPGRDTGLLGIDRRAELLAGQQAAQLGDRAEAALRRRALPRDRVPAGLRTRRRPSPRIA